MSHETEAGFRAAASYNKELREISEPYEKKIIEAEKAAVEFSKIILTILYSSNAGGLVAIPAMLSFLGLGNAEDRFKIFAGCAIGFGVGLIATAICALLIHRNYRHLSQTLFQHRESAVYEFRSMTGGYGGAVAQADKRQADRKATTKIAEASLRRTNFGAYVAGTLAVLSFVATCLWVGSRFL